MRCVPASWQAWPTVTKIADLVSECTVMCNSAPNVASGPPTPNPKVISPICLLEAGDDESRALGLTLLDRVEAATTLLRSKPAPLARWINRLHKALEALGALDPLL